MSEILIYSSITRHHQVNLASKGEYQSKKLKQVHGQKAVAKFRAQKRSFPLISADLENSTSVADDLGSDMYYVMKYLLMLLKLTHQRIGYEWTFQKPNGDCHLILLSTLEVAPEDIERVTFATQEDLPNYRKLLKFFDPRLDIHIEIMAISSYFLGGDPPPKTFKTKELNKLMKELSRGQKVDIPDSEDFYGQDPNYLMKGLAHAPKGFFKVLGKLEYFSDSLLRKTAKIEALSQELKQQNRSRIACDMADRYGFVYALIPEDKNFVHDENGWQKILEKVEILKERFAKSQHNHSA